MILPPAAANINSLLGSETCRVKNVTCRYPSIATRYPLHDTRGPTDRGGPTDVFTPAPICSPSKVDWLQQQVIQRRAQRIPRILQVNSANTKTNASGLPQSGRARALHRDDSTLDSTRLPVSLFVPSSCSLEPETDP